MPSNDTMGVRPPAYDDSRGSIDLGSLDLGEPVRQRGDTDVYEATVDGRDVEIRRPHVQGRVTATTAAYIEGVREWASVDDHENILTVVDWGATEDGPWVATERTGGETLADRIDDFDAGAAIRFAERLTRAFLYSHHEAGLVHHHALTPERILVEDGTPVVDDLGTARVLDERAGPASALSPAYGAPEQFDPDTFHEPDQRVDVYRVGAILYEMLTGDHPYQGTDTEIVHAATDPNTDPDPPSDRADVPDGTDAVLSKALATDPRDRYWTADEFGRALAELVGEGDRYRSGLGAWPQAGVVPEHTCRMVDEGPDGSVREDWSVDVSFKTRFAVGDGRVFTMIGEAGDNYFVALDEATGDEEWRYELGNLPALAGTPVVDDGTVYAPIAKMNELVAFDVGTGDVEWTADVTPLYDPDIDADPVLADGTFYVPDGQAGITAIDQADGERGWTFEADNDVEAPPTVADGRVFVRDAAGVVYALDAEDGSELWRDDERLDADHTDKTYARPVAAHGQVYVSFGRHVHAFDAETGTPQWEFHPGPYEMGSYFNEPAVGGGTLFATSEDRDLYALAADTGEQKWHRNADGASAVADGSMTTATVGNGEVYYGMSGSIRALDADTGDQHWQVDSSSNWREIVVADGNVYSSVGVGEGDLVKFSE